MAWNTIDDMDLTGKTVLTRVDLNVPMADGVVTDTTRIDKIIPTIRDLRAKGATVVLLAHFGRPKGKVVPEMSLGQIVPALDASLGAPVKFFGMDMAANVAALDPGAVALLENTRFDPGEETNDPAFVAKLAALGDVFCNDAFSAAHRAHASTTGLAHALPSCAGRLMEAELRALDAALGTPQRPVVAVVGGAKVSTKLELLGNLVERVDHLVIGGGMANTFLAAQGLPVGKSLCEHDLAPIARAILAEAEKCNCTIHLPLDIVVAERFAANAPNAVYQPGDCPEDGMILDAGPDSIAHLSDLFATARTLIWNGPLGAFEIQPFDAATNAAAQAAAAATQRGDLVTVAGGGDTVAALNKAGAASQFTYISTAGGAFLEWMEGKTLPGVAALGA